MISGGWRRANLTRDERKTGSTRNVALYRNDAEPAIASVEHTHASVVHKRMARDELEQVGFDVRANDAVRFDDRARF